jgi:NAD(P)-dependent dehydrogenase (short-subunit alcohol dehydrogenase family)
MFTEELARRLKGTRVTANAVHPGIFLFWWFLASSPEVTGISGQYFTKAKRTPVKNKFDTPANRALLWDLSMTAMQHYANAA